MRAGFDCSVLGSGVNPRRGASPTLAVTRRRYDDPQALYNKGDVKMNDLKIILLFGIYLSASLSILYLYLDRIHKGGE